MKNLFGFGKKSKNYDLLLLIPQDVEGQGRRFYQILFPSAAASDFIQLMIKLQRSSLNSAQVLGDLGGFSVLSHIEGLEKVTILDQVHPESEPISFQDFSNHLLHRFNHMLSGEEGEEEGDGVDLEAEEQDDLVYFIGEFTLMKDGSF